MASDYYKRPIQPFLRDPPNTHARSAYAVEVNPWTTRGDVEAALLFRGAIVSAHGEIDFRIASLCIRCSYIEQYLNVREKYPYSFTGRLKYLRQVFYFGPLARYKNFAYTVLDRLEGDYEFRNLIAHARMQVLPENWVIFQDFPRSDGLEVTKRQEPLPLIELERRAWKAALRSRACQRLSCALDNAGVLPGSEPE